MNKHFLFVAALLLIAHSAAGCGASPTDNVPLSFETASLNATIIAPYQRPAVQAGRIDPSRIPTLTNDDPRPGTTGHITTVSSSNSSRSQVDQQRQTQPREHHVDNRSYASNSQRSAQRNPARSTTVTHTSQPSGSERSETSSTLTPPPTSVPGLEGPSDNQIAQNTDIKPSGNNALDYVRSVYSLNGISFQSGSDMRVIDLYRSVQRQGRIYHAHRPIVGDLVFFHNTRDANHDNRNNDWYSHVGIVESVNSNGTISFLHFADGAVTRSKMNLKTATPGEGADRRTNSVLREKQGDDPRYTQYLSADLFAGFGTVLKDRSEFYVLDDWKPSDGLDIPNELHASQ